jgi:hypothetical protein
MAGLKNCSRTKIRRRRSANELIVITSDFLRRNPQWMLPAQAEGPAVNPAGPNVRRRRDMYPEFQQKMKGMSSLAK